MKQHVADVMAPGDHGSTFAGNPLVCAAANTTFDIIADPDFLADVERKGERLRGALRDALGDNPHVKVRVVVLAVAATPSATPSPRAGGCRFHWIASSLSCYEKYDCAILNFRGDTPTNRQSDPQFRRIAQPHTAVEPLRATVVFLRHMQPRNRVRKSASSELHGPSCTPPHTLCIVVITLCIFLQPRRAL